LGISTLLRVFSVTRDGSDGFSPAWACVESKFSAVECDGYDYGSLADSIFSSDVLSALGGTKGPKNPVLSLCAAGRELVYPVIIRCDL